MSKGKENVLESDNNDHVINVGEEDIDDDFVDAKWKNSRKLLT